eukprot:14359477-Alexandrium_andersonii.AAC.1
MHVCVAVAQTVSGVVVRTSMMQPRRHGARAPRSSARGPRVQRAEGPEVVAGPGAARAEPLGPRAADGAASQDAGRQRPRARPVGSCKCVLVWPSLTQGACAGQRIRAFLLCAVVGGTRGASSGSPVGVPAGLEVCRPQLFAQVFDLVLVWSCAWTDRGRR